jgi:hypothetical protein
LGGLLTERSTFTMYKKGTFNYHFLNKLVYISRRTVINWMGWLHYDPLSVTTKHGRDFNGARDLMLRYLYRESGEDKSLPRTNVVGPSLRSGFNELPITQFQDPSQYASGFHTGGTLRRNVLRSARPH